jgi:hypothetical protein
MSSSVHRALGGLPPRFQHRNWLKLSRVSADRDHPTPLPTADLEGRPEPSIQPRARLYFHVGSATYHRDPTRLSVERVDAEDQDVSGRYRDRQVPHPAIPQVISRYFAGQHRLVWTQHVRRRQRHLLDRPGSIFAKATWIRRAEADQAEHKGGSPESPPTFRHLCSGRFQLSRLLEFSHRELGKYDLSSCHPRRTVPPPLAIARKSAHASDIMDMRRLKAYIPPVIAVPVAYATG